MARKTARRTKANRPGITRKVNERAGAKKATGRRSEARRTAAGGRPTRRHADKAASAGTTKTRRHAVQATVAARGAKPRRRTAQKAKPKPRHTTGHGKRAAEALVTEIRQYYDASGFLSWSAAAKKFVILGTNEQKGGLVDCPECGLGQLMVVRSKATRKRFIGCSNYYSGCDASSPLLQKARLRALKQPCPSCGWPMVIFRYARTQKWTRQCSNVRCPTRAAPPGQS